MTRKGCGLLLGLLLWAVPGFGIEKGYGLAPGLQPDVWVVVQHFPVHMASNCHDGFFRCTRLCQLRDTEALLIYLLQSTEESDDLIVVERSAVQIRPPHAESLAQGIAVITDEQSLGLLPILGIVERASPPPLPLVKVGLRVHFVEVKLAMQGDGFRQSL